MGKAGLGDKMIGKTQKVRVDGMIEAVECSFVNRLWVKCRTTQRCMRRESCGRRVVNRLSVGAREHLMIDMTNRLFFLSCTVAS